MIFTKFCNKPTLVPDRVWRYNPEGQQLGEILIPLRINPVVEKLKQGCAKALVDQEILFRISERRNVVRARDQASSQDTTLPFVSRKTFLTNFRLRKSDNGEEKE